MDQYLNKITQGDALLLIKELPDNSIDAIITDPPYGVGMDYDGDDSVETAQKLLFEFLASSYTKLKPRKHIAIFWTMRYLDVCIDTVRSAGFLYRRTLSMYIPKGNARPYLGILPRTQPVVIAQHNGKKIDIQEENPGYDDQQYMHDTLVVHNKNTKMLHPSQKPLSVMKKLICALTRRNNIVLDGFSGSGTTALACRETERQFVGFEKSLEFCEIARKRLETVGIFES